jgi:UBX domain-containing protein 1
MATPSPQEQSTLISQFCAIVAGIQPEQVSSADFTTGILYSFAGLQARDFLVANDWNLEAAITTYFTGDAEDVGDDQDEGPVSQQPGSSGTPQGPVGRTLDGRVVPSSAGSSSRTGARQTTRPPRQSGLRTLQDLQNEGGGPSQPHSHNHGHAHDDDEEEEDADKQDLFAGGEKSGLAVQNPGQNSRNPHQAIRDMIRKAGR